MEGSRWRSSRRRRRRSPHPAGCRCAASICSRASRPMTACSSRTRYGYGCGADRRAEQVVGAERVGDPVAQRLVDRGAQRAVAAGHRHHLWRRAAACGRRSAPGAPCRSRPCTPCTGSPSARAGGGARDAVLAGAGLGDDASRTEAPREQRLADGVVDLVRAGVRQILALEPHVARPSAREPRGAGQRGRSARPSRELALQLGAGNRASCRCCAHAALEALERRDQRLGHIAAAERAEAAARIRETAGDQLGEQPCGIACSCSGMS